MINYWSERNLSRQDSLQWRHNEGDGVSNHQPHDCLLNRLFRRRSKKTSKFRVTSLRDGIHRSPMNSPYKGPVMRKMLPYDDVIKSIAMITGIHCIRSVFLLKSIVFCTLTWNKKYGTLCECAPELKRQELYNLRLQWSFWFWAQPMREDVAL